MLALAAVLAGAVPAAATQPASAEPRVTVALLPAGTTATQLAQTPSPVAVGLMSPGLGRVAGAQSYLDISQGNRLFDSLYPFDLPFLRVGAEGVDPAQWSRVLRRADDAPAQLEPGLLAATLLGAGVPIGAERAAGNGGLVAVQPDGAVDRPSSCPAAGCPGVTVTELTLAELRTAIAQLRDDDLLIALERLPSLRRQTPIAIAGRGFDGVLRSETTRLDGFVLSTDIGPTILGVYDLGAPDAMTGRPISSTTSTEATGLVGLQTRLESIASRRHPVLGVNLLIWIGLALAFAAAGRRWAARAVSVLSATVAWVPALLLAGAALEPSVLGERLLIGLGAPALSIGALLALRFRFGARTPFAAFALAATASVAATAVDVLAGSPLTALSVIGPNPGLGVRFFGIGNELEAVIAVLLATGAGAAVAAAGPADPGKAVSATIVAATIVAVLIFAPGRWGADVGAAIAFPAGAAGVIGAALGFGRRRLLLLLGAPVVALGLLIGIDIAIGGDAHLSRSVLEAGGLEELGQVVERRTRLAAASFTRFFDTPFFLAALAAIVVMIGYRRRILGWFADQPAPRAGLIGGATATVVGTLANDSGALILMVGAAYLFAFALLGNAVQYFTSDSHGH